MASEGSVAPKERVNIVYKTDTGGAQQEKELPLKMLVMGDFTQRADSTPVDTPATSQRIEAPTARDAVTGARSSRSGQTGCLVMKE